MFNKKMGMRLALIAMIFAMLFTACKSTPTNKEVGTELAPWAGEWVSMATATKSSELDAVYEKTAKKMPNYTAGGLKDAVVKMYDCPVLKIKANGTNTLKVTIMDANGKPKTVNCEYKFESKVEIKGFEGSFWYTFRSLNHDKELKSIHYLIMTEAHDHGDGKTHWHARFGARSIEALVNDESAYWPTFVKASTSEKELVENFKQNIPNMDKFLPASPFKEHEKYDGIKNGKWINLVTVLEMNDPEIDKAYDKIIKQYAGQNPKGGDFTKAELKEIAKNAAAGMAGAGKFTHLQFVTKNGQNTLILWNNNKKVFESKYNRIEAHPYKPGFMAMEAEKATKSYKTILFTPPHFNHMHLVYGNTDKEMEENNFGTFIPADGSKEMMAGMVAYVLNGRVRGMIQKNEKK